MAQLINLKTFTDKRGNLTVIEKIIPFTIKRIFYIYGVDDSIRGGHRHINTIQAAVCIKGSCKINCYGYDYDNGTEYNLKSPSELLILEPQDWHTMYHFTPDAILMVFASEEFDAADYIFEKYKNN